MHFVGNFAVALRKEEDGTFTGMKSTMFDYSKKWLVSFEKYKELLLETALEWDRKHKLKKLAVMFPETDPEWEQKRETFLVNLVDKKYMHIKHFDNHLIEEGNRIFSGTEAEDSWCIYSDGLVQYWTKENLAYLESKGFGGRLWRAEGETNAGTRYEGKVTGDSPELNVGTDNNGFKDLGWSMGFHVGLSFLYPTNDDRRFSLSTIDEISSTMSR